MKVHFQLKETIVTIVADEKKYIEIAKESIISQREILERYIRFNPYFKSTLEPFQECDENVDEIIKRMVSASNTIGIGPMSAVAGTIASFAVEAMVNAGATYAIVDNGGDIAFINDRPILIGIYAGESEFKDFAFSIPSRNTISGVCTSSGTVGPSISFGMSDASIVFSDNVSLADSAATELGNSVEIGKKSIEDAFSKVNSIQGINGAVIIQDNYIGAWGTVPEIVRAKVNYECITKG